MAHSVTIANLITRAKYRADAENVTHVGEPEWQVYIAEAFRDVHAIVAETGHRMYETEYSIPITGATSYSLPTAVLSVVGVEFETDSSGSRRPLRRIMAQERTFAVGATGEAFEYELTGVNVALWPTPSSGTYYLTYIPQSTDYATAITSTSVDCVCPAGEKFITWQAAILAMHKGEQNLQFAVSERERARAELEVWAANRTINDANRRVGIDDYPYGDWP